MKPPDIVVDSHNLAAKNASVPRFDTLKRERLPKGWGSTELEWRDHPLDLAVRLLITNGQLGLWLFITFCVTAFAVAPLGRMYGSDLFSPLTYPLICFASGLVAYFRFVRTSSFAESLLWFLLPQGTFVLLEWAFSPGIDRRWAVIPIAVAVGAVGYLADQINTHYVWFITASLRLNREASVRRRDLWRMRFNWRGLSKEIAQLNESIHLLEADGKAEEAYVLRRRAGDLRELRDYPLGFGILLYCAVLLLFGVSGGFFSGAALLFAVLLAFRRPLLTAKLSRLIVEVVIHAFVSWFSWDPKQAWVNSPGLFRDELLSRFRRKTLAVGTFALLQLVFIPSVDLWGKGEVLTPLWLWTAGFEFFSNLFIPVTILACTLIATGGRPLWLQLEAVEMCDVSDELTDRNVWDAAVGRLQSSRSKLEREHLWLGTHAEYGYPVLIHKKLLVEHVHVLGSSGSGKTSRILAPLITQLIRGGDGPVIIIDLKGEMAQLVAARQEARRSGRRFKLFTNLLGRATHLYNPIQQVNSRMASVSQFVETLMESLRLNYGDGYGTRFFTSQTRQWLLETCKRWPNLSSFEELYSKATPEFFRSAAEMDRCREAIAVIQQIAEVTALNWKPGPGQSDAPLRDAIYMPDVIRERQVVYFWLPAIGETSTVREIAMLVLYGLLTAMKEYRDAGGRGRAYLGIDEVQQMASDGFKLVFRQARSLGLSLIVANQSESDLMNRQRLLDTIRANTQVKIYMSVNDPLTIKMLEKSSGLVPYSAPNGSLTYLPRLNYNNIGFYSSHSDYCICWTSRDSGFTAYGGDWFGVKTDFHISQEEFEERDRAEWPAATEETIIAERSEGGAVTLVQGTAKPGTEEAFGNGRMDSHSFTVPPDSRWAKRLNDVYERRYAVKGGTNDGVE